VLSHTLIEVFLFPSFQETYHPMLSDLLHVAYVDPEGQLKLAKNTQEMRETITCPKFHQAERAVRRY